jgi:hypothetical protein
MKAKMIILTGTETEKQKSMNAKTAKTEMTAPKNMNVNGTDIAPQEPAKRKKISAETATAKNMHLNGADIQNPKPTKPTTAKPAKRESPAAQHRASSKDVALKPAKKASKKSLAAYLCGPSDPLVIDMSKIESFFPRSDSPQSGLESTHQPQTPRAKPPPQVEPPTFHPVRAAIPETHFPNRLKIREFVLKCYPPREYPADRSRKGIQEIACSRKTHQSPDRPL